MSQDKALDSTESPKGDEVLRRMLKTPPKPQNRKTPPKPQRGLVKKDTVDTQKK